jgi:hypothetical protein
MITASRLRRTGGGSDTDKVDAAGIDTGDLAMISIRKLLLRNNYEFKSSETKEEFLEF